MVFKLASFALRFPQWCFSLRFLHSVFRNGILACVFDGRALLELQHDGPHAGHVFGVLGRLGIEVAQLGHALPF